MLCDLNDVIIIMLFVDKINHKNTELCIYSWDSWERPACSLQHVASRSLQLEGVK